MGAKKVAVTTKSAYRMRLDDLVCDEEGCERLSEICIVYGTDKDEFFHQFWCGEHEARMAPGSEVFEVEEDWPPVDAEDEAIVDDLVNRRMKSKKITEVN